MIKIIIKRDKKNKTREKKEKLLQASKLALIEIQVHKDRVRKKQIIPSI
jgi:hypothetical protein